MSEKVLENVQFKKNYFKVSLKLSLVKKNQFTFQQLLKLLVCDMNYNSDTRYKSMLTFKTQMPCQCFTG